MPAYPLVIHSQSTISDPSSYPQVEILYLFVNIEPFEGCGDKFE